MTDDDALRPALRHRPARVRSYGMEGLFPAENMGGDLQDVSAGDVVVQGGSVMMLCCCVLPSAYADGVRNRFINFKVFLCRLLIYRLRDPFPWASMSSMMAVCAVHLA